MRLRLVVLPARQMQVLKQIATFRPIPSILVLVVRAEAFKWRIHILHALLQGEYARIHIPMRFSDI